MLVLTRKLNQAILIAGNVRVRVTRIGRSSIRLAIEAPREIPVLREEVLDAADLPAGLFDDLTLFERAAILEAAAEG